MSRWRCALVVAFLLSLSLDGATDPLAAQAFRVIPQAGLYVPVQDHGDLPPGVAGAVELGRKSSTLGLGLGVEVDLPLVGPDLRGSVLYGTSSPVPYVAEDCPACSTRSTVLVATAAAVIRPLPRLRVARPYLLAGGGLKRHAFDHRELRDDGFEGVFRDQTRGTLHLGAGVDLRLGGISATAELGSFLSSFEPGGGEGAGPAFPAGESRFMSDYFLMVGLAFGR